VGPGAIQVDGSLDEPGWAGVAFTAGFLQKRPVDDPPVVDPTTIATLFDEKRPFLVDSRRMFAGVAGTATVMKLSTRGGSIW